MSEITEVKLVNEVGPASRQANGATPSDRADVTGAKLMAAAHGTYAEAVYRGRVNIASTAVTGVAMGTALSTTPPFALWNPVGSGVVLSILMTTVSYLSGTLSYGVINYGTVVQATEPSSGTSIVPKNARSGRSRGLGRCYTGSTQTAATVLMTPYHFGPELGTTVQQISASGVVCVDGLIMLDPGYVFVMESTSAGAGTSPLCIMGCAWEEIEIPV
jgi:hypothetical protein